MSVLRISRAHRLTAEELRARVDQLALKLVASYGGDYRWHGDLVRYRRPGGIDAQIHCASAELRIEVTLGPLAGFLRGAIERELGAALDRHLPA